MVVQDFIKDVAYYINYFEENDECFITPYIEQKFNEESWSYEYSLMRAHPYFTYTIMEDEKLSDVEKQEIFFNNLVHSDNNEGKIVLVDGAMGGGKTGFGCWALDEYHKRKEELNYFFVTKATSPPILPKWIKIVNNIGIVEEITLKSKRNSVALIDEGAIQLNSRRSMSKDNIDASMLLVQLRQRGITLIILVQNVNMVDVNVRELASIRVLKFGVEFGTNQRQKGIKISDDLKLIRRRLKPRNKKEAYFEIQSLSICLKFQHPLPIWWDNEKVSKYMKNWDNSEKKENQNNKDKEEEVELP